MTTTRRIVAALGGNAIAKQDHRGNIQDQFSGSRETATHIADLLDAGHRILITHGNGPQVGATLRRVELSRHEIYPIPLALCVADTQAGMGYMICECLRNETRGRGREALTCAVTTSVRVDADDEAFANPRKQIGQEYDEATARGRVADDGWHITEVGPGRFRRVVPSPIPLAIEEIGSIRGLFEAGQVVVCCGGGGIPVVRDAAGGSHTVEAVIDKDLTSALLAIEAEADTLAILTNVERVMLDWGTDRERGVSTLTVGEARAALAAGQFGAGTMEPKVRACVRFIEESSSPDPIAFIARTDRCQAALDGASGTRILPDATR